MASGRRSRAQATFCEYSKPSNRRLWEAGERCESGEAVVGVVGAAHVPAIRREWARAGAAEVSHKARRASPLPKTSPFLCLCIALLNKKRKEAWTRLRDI